MSNPTGPIDQFSIHEKRRKIGTAEIPALAKKSREGGEAGGDGLSPPQFGRLIFLHRPPAQIGGHPA